MAPSVAPRVPAAGATEEAVYEAGQSGKFSFLDMIVPGYYLWMDAAGVPQQSSCCPNTASEFAMMERLMLDSQRFWTQSCMVDGGERPRAAAGGAGGRRGGAARALRRSGGGAARGLRLPPPGGVGRPA